MKKLILIATVILFSNHSFAKKNKVEKIKTNHLNYDEYIQQYGIDDTCIAIIEIYFDKRDNSGIGQMSILPATMGVALISPPIGIGLMTISSPLFISGAITNHRYSHKNLIKALNNYHNHNLLTCNLRKKVANLMVAEQEIRDEEMEEKRLASLQSIK